jgi:uncharacterized protein (DUF2235 family)
MKMGKNIVICYDGTGAEYGENNTNVVKTFESIIRDKEQIGFYDPGVGTFSFLGRTAGKRLGIFLGKAFGVGLQQNIEDGYEYLMNRFKPDDKIFLFGFSRGAFTVRALAGMIYRFGILQKGSKNLIPYVSKMYNKRDFSVCNEFKETFCHICEPHFVGVWDTVASLGYIHGRTFYDQTLNPEIKHGCQAIAIDEKRKKFRVSLWDETKEVKGQNIEQVWFAGVHSDVGGWYQERGLSDIAFAWMMDKASACGMRLKDNWSKSLRQNALDTLHNSRTGIWKLWSSIDRQIPEGAKIHKSVIDRMEKDDGYNPALPKNFDIVTTASYIAP